MPVIVVGNIVAGGTGKTPLVTALHHLLVAAGNKVGIVSRGYGGSAGSTVRLVSAADNAAEVGDEPLMMARRGVAPIAVCSDRVRAAQLLVEQCGVEYILSDDGLQHYRLQRQMEIAVLDSGRGRGNGRLLPAGPLRESAERLKQVDLVLWNGDGPQSSKSDRCFWLQPQKLYRVSDNAEFECALLNGVAVHAVCGIGNPRRFFDTLRALGADPIAHPLPDHHDLRAEELDFDDDLIVVMTEKDAVKAMSFVGENHYYLKVQVMMSDSLKEELVSRMVGLTTTEAKPVPR